MSFNQKKEKHLEYLKSSFNTELVESVMTKKQIMTLKKYGSWLQGLHKGELDCITDKQKDFVECLKKDTPPENEIYKVYWIFVKRQEIVKTQKLSNVKKLIPDDREDWKKIRKSRY